MVEEQNATLIREFVDSVKTQCHVNEDVVANLAAKLGYQTREIYFREMQTEKFKDFPSDIMRQLPAKIAEQEKLKGELENLWTLLKA